MILYVLSTFAVDDLTRVSLSSLSTLYQRITEASLASLTSPREYPAISVCPGYGALMSPLSTTKGTVLNSTVPFSSLYDTGVQLPKYDLTFIAAASLSLNAFPALFDKSTASPVVRRVLYSAKLAFSGLTAISYHPASLIRLSVILVLINVTRASAPQGLPR